MMETDVDFGSPEDLADLLERVGMRLHAKNRIAAGESGYLWHIAEAIRATGALARLELGDPKLMAAFGDGYQPATLSRDARRAHFLHLLGEQMALAK